MASVFLSYVHEDSDKARPIARILERAGHQVWWDRFIKGGAEYSDQIEAELNKADFVVVLWSDRSIHSAWVRDEAGAGCRNGRLVPLSLDQAEPPLGFRQFQTIDLVGWKGHGEARLRPLLEALSSPSAEPVSALSASDLSGPWTRLKRPLLLVALVAAILAGAFVAWTYLKPSSSIPLVAVHAAEPTGAARGYARDLLVKLGSLQSSKTDRLRLIGDDQGENADLIFDVGASGQGRQETANLALFAGKDRSLLWSKDFKQQAQPGDLRQSVAYTAAQVLGCALEEAGQQRSRLDLQTLKLFLNACALFGERYRSNPASVVPIFTQVVSSAPRFEPAWSRLLLAEAQDMRGQMLFFDRWAPGNLPQHTRQARKLNPQLPELNIAEAALLPVDDLEQRLRLMDEAVRLSPDNPDLRVARAEFYSFIGRNNEGEEDARRAIEINPLSPGFRSNLIQLLIYAGQLSTAEKELLRAEQLWPTTPTIEDSRFRFDSRFGDPNAALRMMQSPDFRQIYATEDMVSYLEARILPTDANVRRAIVATQSPQWGESRRLVQAVQLLAEFGRHDQAFQLLRDVSPKRLRTISPIFYRPALQKFREDRRFMPLVVRAGLVDFWRKSGKWPDFCSDPDLPYDCKQEAAKLAT